MFLGKVPKTGEMLNMSNVTLLKPFPIILYSHLQRRLPKESSSIGSVNLRPPKRLKPLSFYKVSFLQNCNISPEISKTLDTPEKGELKSLPLFWAIFTIKFLKNAILSKNVVHRGGSGQILINNIYIYWSYYLVQVCFFLEVIIWPKFVFF